MFLGIDIREYANFSVQSILHSSFYSIKDTNNVKKRKYFKRRELTNVEGQVCGSAGKCHVGRNKNTSDFF